MAVTAWTDSLCFDRPSGGRLFLPACILLLVASAFFAVTPAAAQDAEPPKPAEAKPEPKAKTEPEKPPADPPPKKPEPEEVPAATPPTAQPAAVAPQASTIDFSGLTNPAVVASLKLSAEQQTQVTAIRTERDAALAAATDEAAKLTINNQADQKIAAALDDVQLRLLGALFSKKKLQFNFRFQKWEQVLEWIAEEANLSLVMDAPPPGTFNYADTKEYSPIQAIDLLNGWLLTKNYALIRRDRLLMCVSLKGGIPAGVVPRVTPAELPIRGKFELVTAMFPLEGRPAESALKEVQTLLGPHSDVDALEQTQQLAVTDTAGNLRAIEKLITSIPVPEAPAKPAPKPPAPPKPTLVVYPVKTLSIDKAIELLGQLVTGKIVGDNDARQISIHAIPDQQTLAKQILDQLEANTGPDKQSRIELYTLKGLGPEGVGSSEYTELLATLQLIAPAAQFRFDAHTRKLVTWASPAEHAKIKESIDQLQRTGIESGARQLEVYPLTKADPDTTLSLLKELLPDARLALDTKSRTLIAIASRRDQLAVAALLDQLQPETPRPDTPTLQSYPTETELTASETELLSALVPDANVTVDAENKRLLVIASPDDQQAIQKAIEQMSETSTKQKPSLAAYPVADEVTTSVTDLLTTLAPDAQVTVDAENKRLLVVASPADHEIVKNALEQVGEQPLDSQRELRSYTLAEQVDTTTASSLISSLVPNAQVTPDATNRRMMIVATSAEHTVIAKTIAQISDELSGQLRELRFYSLKTATGANVVTILGSLVAAAQVTHDDANNRLTVVATDEEHTLIASTLEKLQQAVGEAEKNALRIYPVTAAQRTRFQAIAEGLASELPGMQVITDAQPGELAIWAKPSQHAVVAEVLSQLQPVVPEEEKPKLISYPVTKADVATVHEVLTTLFPETKITVDEKASRLLIWAQPKEHETIRSAIGQLDTDTPIETELKLMSYPIESLDPTVTLQLLQEELPKVIFVQDTTAGTLIARARVREHERIASLLETLRTHAKSNLERSVVVYPAVWGDVTQATAFMQSAFPEARMVFDPRTSRMTVWATERDHGKIQQAVEDFGKAGSEADAKVLVSYNIRGEASFGLVLMFRRVVPQAQVIANQAGTKLHAWARPADQQIIKQIVTELVSGGADDADRSLQIYDVRTIGQATATEVLSASLPDVSFHATSDGRALVAWVNPQQAKDVTEVLGQIAQSDPVRDARNLEVFPVGALGLANARQILTGLLPAVTFVDGTDGQSLIAWVRAEESKKIADALAELADAHDEQGDKVLEVYNLGDRVDPTALQTVLAPLTDADVQVTVDPTAERVFVRATPRKQAKFKTTLESIINSLAEMKDLVTQVYNFPNSDAGYAQIAITRLLPHATITSDSRGRALIVVATPADQKTVKQVVEQMAEKTKDGSELKVYSTADLGGGDIATMIVGMLPTARVTPGTQGKHVAVWAKPDEHEQIAEALAQLAAAQQEHGDKVLEVYKLGNRVDPTALQTVLAPLVDADVQVTVDPTAERVFVRATAEKQTEFKKTLESIIESLSEQKDLVTEVYSFPNADAVSALTALTRLLPQATMTTDSSAQALVVTASPADQQTVKQVVEQMLKKSKGDSELKVYSTADLGGGDIATMIVGMLPTARVTPGTQGKHVAVWAKPDEHVQIAEALSQLAKAQEQQDEKVLQVYKLGHRVDADAIQNVLEPLVDDDVQVTADPTAERLFVRATPAKQKQFKETIDSIIESLSEQQDLVTQVYAFPAGDADTAEEALQRLLPHATLTTDRRERALVATATAKDQQTIKQVVEELLRKSEDRNVRQAQAYRLTVADPENVRDVLQGLYGRGSDVQISLDERNRTILAVASRYQQEAIAALIEKIEKDSPNVEKRSVKSYELSTIDGEAAEEIVQTVLDRDDPTATIVFEPQSQQLVVSTTASVHKQIVELVDSLQAKERELEVFQLEVLDASSASFTIDSLYDFGFGSPNAPTIESDEDTQQLLVRGTQAQIEQIRGVLIKMGETSLGLRDGGAANRKNLRVIHLDGDADAAIQRIEQLWPKLRNNPIRILRPSSNRLRRIGPSGTEPSPQPREDEDAESPQSAIEPESPQDDALAALSTDEPSCVDALCGPDADDETQPDATQPAEPTAEPTKTAAQQPNASDSESAPKPIVIIEGDRSLTIASDDLEALDQLETLLRALTRRKIGGSYGHEFVVYAMQNSGASAVVETLNQLYTTRKGRSTPQISSGNVVFVPDERLNAVIVYANRKDRERIEDLIQTLDTEQVPQSLQTNRTEVVLLKHAQAARVQSVIQSIYRAQMSPGKSRASVAIPAGVPPEVASVLRQINASASSPLLTVEADETTNSLVVMAPATLLEEVTGLIEQLDETAGTNRAYGVTVIPLKKTNASTLMRALGRIAR